MEQAGFTEYMAEMLEDTYCNYDSEMVAEDLLTHGVQAYLERRSDIVQGSVVSYTYDPEDETKVLTLIIGKAEETGPNLLQHRGFMVIQNLQGSYDIHEFWRTPYVYRIVSESPRIHQNFRADTLSFSYRDEARLLLSLIVFANILYF